MHQLCFHASLTYGCYHLLWLENVSCAERAIDLWPKICQYVKKVGTQKKADIPTCQSFITVQEAVGDNLVIPRLHAFVSVYC